MMRQGRASNGAARPRGASARQAYGSLARVDLDALVGDWLTLSDLASRLGTSPNGVRRLLEERELVGVRRGSPKVLSVPADFLDGDVPLAALKGTLMVLGDIGFSDEEMIEWLFTPDDTLPGGAAHPTAAMRAGFKTEVRRRAMEQL